MVSREPFRSQVGAPLLAAVNGYGGEHVGEHPLLLASSDKEGEAEGDALVGPQFIKYLAAGNPGDGPPGMAPPLHDMIPTFLTWSDIFCLLRQELIHHPGQFVGSQCGKLFASLIQFGYPLLSGVVFFEEVDKSQVLTILAPIASRLFFAQSRTQPSMAITDSPRSVFAHGVIDHQERKAGQYGRVRPDSLCQFVTDLPGHRPQGFPDAAAGEDSHFFGLITHKFTPHLSRFFPSSYPCMLPPGVIRPLFHQDRRARSCRSTPRHMGRC